MSKVDLRNVVLTPSEELEQFASKLRNAWLSASLSQRAVIAHNTAMREATDPLNRSDPHTYRRVYSHVIHGIYAPSDYVKT